MKTVFIAKKIITMEHDMPFATHVAVEDGKIVGVGGEELLSTFQDFEVEKRFDSHILLPGFIEGHAHLAAGQDGLAPYVGYFDRPSPDGAVLKGLKSFDEVLRHLQEVDKQMKPGEPLMALGFDPIYFDRPNPTRADLDKVSTDRMVILYHVSGHLMTVNSKTIEAIPKDKLSLEGIKKDAQGNPTGELAEMKTMMVVFEMLGPLFKQFMDPTILFPRFVSLAKMAGVTTITEMGLSVNLDDPKTIDLLIQLTENASIRLVPMYFIPTTTKKPEEIPGYVKSLAQRNTEKLRFGNIKMMADGSIQGFTARLKKPYINGVQNGLWNQDPENLTMFMKLFTKEKMQVNCHCNGDEASEAFLSAVEEALKETPWTESRHVIQHGQMMDDGQFQKAKELGVAVNLFTNHIYYWGDQHVEKTVGLERAEKMDAANTAQRLGISYSMHCDASVTPIAPLMNIWTAVNRVTASGNVLGEQYRITPQEGFYAMTMGTATLLKLEEEIGSIKVGKKADFVILDQDPYEIDPMSIKDITVVTTVINGNGTSHT